MNNFKYLDDAMMTGVVGGVMSTPGKDDVPAEGLSCSCHLPDQMDNGADGMAFGKSHPL